jgi:hypothetical protein
LDAIWRRNFLLGCLKALAQGARGVQTSAGDRAERVLDLLAKLTSTRCHIWALRFDLA